MVFPVRYSHISLFKNELYFGGLPMIIVTGSSHITLSVQDFMAAGL